MKMIGYAGAHSSGKTTTVNRIARLLIDLDIKHIIIPETARACPFPIGQNGGFNAEMWILKEQMKREKEAKKKAQTEGIEYIFCDRVVYDCAVYSRVLNRAGSMTDEELRYIEATIDGYSQSDPYDLMYLCEPKPLYDDGKRDTDPMFQASVYTEYKRYIKEKGLIFTMIQ